VGRLPSGPHDEFLELCALSTSGELSVRDENRLREHLAVCPGCREALDEYGSLIRGAIPTIGAEACGGPFLEIDPGLNWSEARSEKRLFERLEQEELHRTGKEEKQSTKNNGHKATSSSRSFFSTTSSSTWRHVWMSYAAGIVLFVMLGFSAYWVGIQRGAEVATMSPESQHQADNNDAGSGNAASLEEQLSDAAHEREVARAQLAERDQLLVSLRHELEQQSAEIRRMKQAQAQLESSLDAGQADQQALIQRRAELAQKLEAAQSESAVLEQKFASLTQQSAQETAHARGLESRVKDLTRLLEGRDASLNQQEELLAHDRDIRELMGARDLYIAEVYDVADNGRTRKPYGRVFYTKGKSLIFYAYDLDQQQSKRVEAAAFQAWGRRGRDSKQALNLGIFYEDNASKKRWVLKSDDPMALAQIDAVFVTLEPNGGSEQPSGKPLLFAYLQMNPNHP
jgi:hypothetical protein